MLKNVGKLITKENSAQPSKSRKLKGQFDKNWFSWLLVLSTFLRRETKV